MHVLQNWRRFWSSALVALMVLALGCQPAVLDKGAVTGGTASADAGIGETAVAGQDVLVQPDPGGTPEVDVPTAADGGVQPDMDIANPVDVQSDVPAPECKIDADCNPKATTCQLATCLTGKCDFQILPNLAACTDGDPCTTGEACQAGACKGGKETVCDDSNPCTKDSCKPTNGCVNAPLVNGPCDDTQPCTTGDHCEAGKCVGVDICKECKVDNDCVTLNACDGPRKCDVSKPLLVPYKCVSKGEGKKCPDDLPTDCTLTFCDPKVGQCATKLAADFVACEDGIPCTLQDECVAGVCSFLGKVSSKQCKCFTNKECELENPQTGNLCLPIYYCDKSTKDWACKPNPATLKTCDTGSDSPCKKNICEPASGKCKLTNVNVPDSFLECDDKLKCTTGDVCENDGICTGTNICPCTSNADCAKEEDGDSCNGTLYCNKVELKCKLNPATVVKCPTALDSACSITLCNKKSGKCEVTPRETLAKSCPVDDPNCPIFVPLPAGQSIVIACDDGDLCTGSSACKSGQCTAEKTAYTCSCTLDADCAKAEDGNKCNGTLFCDKQAGKCILNPATVVNCSSINDSQCAKAVCQLATGQCKLTEIGLPGSYVACEDGNGCTQFDDCEGGACVSGTNTCKCLKDSDCADEDDGNICNGTLFCNKVTGGCEVKPNSQVKCGTTFDTNCLKNTCDKVDGKCKAVAVSELLSCEDNNPCTTGDTCLSGLCSSGLDKCECKTDAECAKMEDGDVCNGTLYCSKAKQPFSCEVNPATVVYCPTGQDQECQKNTCDKITGKCAMTKVPQLFAECSDGNPCTKGDSCALGACVPGSNLCSCTSDVDCAAKDDDNLCNGSLGCLSVGGLKQCLTKPTSPITCDPDTECTKFSCDGSDGKCKAVVSESFCDDGNGCTAESCAVGKCLHTKLIDGTACGISKACTNGTCFSK